jgi:hypothetical protein
VSDAASRNRHKTHPDSSAMEAAAKTTKRVEALQSLVYLTASEDITEEPGVFEQLWSRLGDETIPANNWPRLRTHAESAISVGRFRAS